jgi:hypothetical protein
MAEWTEGGLVISVWKRGSRVLLRKQGMPVLGACEGH